MAGRGTYRVVVRGGGEVRKDVHRELAEALGAIERAGAELADLVTGAPPVVLTDPFAEVTPFERLLSGDA